MSAAEYKRRRIRALVVDDEPLARSNIKLLLSRDPGIDVIAECDSGLHALKVIPQERPDLLFLDVQMPECDGFEVLERLPTNPLPATVFVTAYDQYALKAFEAGALDYLLKPFDDQRFYRALERAKQKIAGASDTPKRTDRFLVRGTGQVWFIKTTDIDWIEAADYYSCLHVGTKTHLLRRSMNELEQELDENRFCRIHRSSIVNLERVEGLKMSAEGEYDVVLNNGVNLRVSRSYRKLLQARLGVRELC